MRRAVPILLALLAPGFLAAGGVAHAGSVHEDRAGVDATPIPPSSEAPARPSRPASRFVAPDGSDAGGCRSAARPCASFDRAYRAAKPGQTVQMAGGDYADQRILRDPAKRSARHVTFRPAPGARVTVAGLDLGTGDNGDGPQHLTLERISTAFEGRGRQVGVGVFPGARDVDLRRIDAGSFLLWGVEDVRVLGGDWGPCAIGPDAPCSNAKIDAGPAGYPTRDVVVRGALFHDFRFGPDCWNGGDCHFECMYVNGSRDVRIQGSRFRDCALYDIFVTLSGPDAARVGHRDLTIENNWLDTPWDESGPASASRARFSALALNWCQNSPLGYRGVRIRNNSFQRNTGILLDPDPACRFERIRVTGNLMGWDGCDERWQYAGNVWSTANRRGRCSDSDRIAGDRFPYRSAASGPGFDFRLATAWPPAQSRVPGPCPRRDAEGEPRRRRNCDAGADERR